MILWLFLIVLLVHRGGVSDANTLRIILYRRRDPETLEDQAAALWANRPLVCVSPMSKSDAQAANRDSERQTSSPIYKTVLLFGPPGVGKGTQSNNIVDDFGLKQVSTGDLLRNETKLQTTLGKKIESIELAKFIADLKLIELGYDIEEPFYIGE